jgi:hypothetical protein
MVATYSGTQSRGVRFKVFLGRTGVFDPDEESVVASYGLRIKK